MTESVDVDRDAVRAALEDAYRRKADRDVNEFELFAYATAIPTGTPDDVALEIASAVLADPPEIDTETDETASPGWFEADFSDTNPGVYAPELTEYDAWMVHFGDKLPYGPWSDPGDPAPCSKHDTTSDRCDCDARYKWGWEPNRRSFEKAELALDDDRFEGLVYIQTEADPFVFVDGDDVRCPESGEVHPAFLAFLEHFGWTYADVSTSGAGVHAYYRGDLPADETVATWQLDSEPWGANDDAPALEIYSGKHVNVTTGEHVAATPREVRPWDAETVHAMVEINTNTGGSATLTTDNKEFGSYGDSGGEETSSDKSECIRALNRLDAREVAGKTIVREWTDDSGDRWAFLPTWGSSDDGGTANFVDSFCWVDTGSRGGRGGPAEMALIDMGELSDRQSEVGYAGGSDFWTGYEHLRDLGFRLPEPPHAKDDESETSRSDYYDADLSAFTDRDPWSDPDAMLEACLAAREAGAVDADTDPPTLALHPILRDLLGVEEAGSDAKEGALEIYHDELTADEFDGEQILL